MPPPSPQPRHLDLIECPGCGHRGILMRPKGGAVACPQCGGAEMRKVPPAPSATASHRPFF